MYYYIVNPAAGGGKISKIQDRLIERLKRLGIFGEFVKSTGPDDVAKLAKLGIARGYKTIVAVGGDGTINEVMNTIIGSEKVALGIIPTGTTNDLADSLGIRDWYSATGILAARKIEEINLGQVGSRYFVTAVAVGFEPKVAHLKRLSKGNLPEKIKFSFSMFRQATSYKSIRAYLRFDNNFEAEAECFNILIAGAGFSPLKKTDKNAVSEKMLDTIVITKISGSEVLKYGYLPKLNSIEWPKISVFHAKKIDIETKKPTDVTADGQLIGQTPVEISITDKKIRMIVSKKRKG